MSVWYLYVWYLYVWYLYVWYLSVWYLSVWYLSVWYLSVSVTLLYAQVMELLLSSQVKGEELADDDPQMSYMISAWARICKILGAGFAPYLPLVMGPVMKTASMKPEVALLDNDEVSLAPVVFFFMLQLTRLVCIFFRM